MSSTARATMTTATMSVRFCTDRRRHAAGAGALLIVLALAGCNAGSGNTTSPSSFDTGYYNTGNCFDNGRTGYARDYSYGDRYLTGQSRSC